MKKVIRCVVFLVVACAMVSPARAENFRVMWYNNDYPPVSFVRDDQKVGVVSDLLKAVCDLTGDTYTFVEAPFPRAQMLFEAGDIDIEPSVSPKWRQDSGVGVYTIAYRSARDVILFADDRTYIEVKSPHDLAGRTLGVVRGYSYPGYDEVLNDGSVKLVESHSEDQLLEMLLMRRVDAIFIHKPFAQYKMKEHTEFSGFKTGAVIGEADIMMRFNIGKRAALPRFNKALKQLKDSGELSAIFDKYR